MPVQDPAEDLLADATVYLLFDRQPPGELEHTVIEQGHTAFQAHGHAGAVEFHQDVVRQIDQRVKEHQLLDECRHSGPIVSSAQPRCGFRGTVHRRKRVGPL